MSTATENNSEARKLWFGMGVSPFAWFAAGLADMFITWRACFHETPFGEAATHDGARALYYISTFFLLAVAAIAAIWSYRNWHRLSGLRRLMQAEARDRAEFMALGGLFISFTLGVGIVWLCLPLFVIQMCLRAR